MKEPELRPGDDRRDPLNEISADDLNGCTNFRELSAEQKLLWLAHAASFALEARRMRLARSK